MKLLLETLQSGADYLAKRGVEEPRLNMEHLLAHVLGCRRLDLYLRFDQQLDEPQLQPLRSLLKRRGEGEPLQHLLGTVPFYDHEFICDHRALIPRPETEYLVSLIVTKEYSGTHKPAQVLDMGTGSGCIGLSLAKAWPEAEVTLVDVSEDALELARLNTHRVAGEKHSVRLIRSHLFEKLNGQTFDLIVANLPYIPAGEIPGLSREVLRDPVTALDGGGDGLDLIRQLIEECPQHLNQNGRVALEFHHDQAPAVSELLAKAGFTEIHTASDLALIERFAFATWPNPTIIPTPPVSEPSATETED